MKTRSIQGLVIVALVVPFSSCPRTTQVSLGVWVFSTVTFEVGVELLANGMVQTPSPLPSEANGSFPTGSDNMTTWMQDDLTFTLTHVAGSDVYAYAGTVDSRTSIIDGTITQTVGGTFSGTWSGRKL